MDISSAGRSDKVEIGGAKGARRIARRTAVLQSIEKFVAGAATRQKKKTR
jgi:hypothetical protein